MFKVSGFKSFLFLFISLVLFSATKRKVDNLLLVWSQSRAEYDENARDCSNGIGRLVYEIVTVINDPTYELQKLCESTMLF